jgi:hypothetical protein
MRRLQSGDSTLTRLCKRIGWKRSMCRGERRRDGDLRFLAEFPIRAIGAAYALKAFGVAMID